MNEIKCPHCGKVFSVDESEYALLLSQVKNNEFHKELEEREKNIKENNKNLIDLEKSKLENKYNLDLSVRAEAMPIEIFIDIANELSK